MNGGSGGPDRSAPHLPSLDGIRAVSFFLVFAAHAGWERVIPGGFGVTVFFFLSGYLITTLLRMEREAHGTVSLRRFYLRRALRILPPFYLVLVLAALAARLGVVPGGVSARAILGQSLLLTNYWIVRFGYAGQPSGTGVFWSLAVEEHFYLVFPCLYLVLSRVVHEPRRQAMVLLVLSGLVLLWRCILVFGLSSTEDRTYVATDTRVDSILFGCALASWGNPAVDGASRIPELYWKRALLPSSLLLLLLTFAYRSPGFRETFRYSLQGVALVPVFVVALRYPAWGPCRILNQRAVSYLGVLSYPLYLVHHVVLSALPPAPTAIRAALALALSIGVAFAIHELVEAPCARVRRRLERAPLAARPAPVAVALLEARRS